LGTILGTILSAIDSNDSLTESDKLTYLSAAIKGKEAAEIVSSSSTKYSGYSTIIDLLKRCYDKRRLVHKLHVKAFVLHQIKNSSYEEICKLHVL